MSHTSYLFVYAASANFRAGARCLRSRVETDVCVIVAGYVELSTALPLFEHGFRIVA